MELRRKSRTPAGRSTAVVIGIRAAILAGVVLATAACAGNDEARPTIASTSTAADEIVNEQTCVDPLRGRTKCGYFPGSEYCNTSVYSEGRSIVIDESATRIGEAKPRRPDLWTLYRRDTGEWRARILQERDRFRLVVRGRLVATASGDYAVEALLAWWTHGPECLWS